MATIAGLQDFRQEGPPADIGTYQIPTGVMVFQHDFSGVTYYVALRSGDRGWILISVGTDYATVGNNAIIYANGVGGDLVSLSSCPAGVSYFPVSTSILMLNNVWLEGHGWHTILRARDALNAAVIYAVGRSNILVRDLYIEGNKANQGAPDGIHPGGIEFYNCSNWKVFNVYVHDVRQFGFWSYSSTAHYNGEIGGCIYDGCGWNGISISTNTYDVTVHDCKIMHSSDVGITLATCFGVLVEHCIVRDMDGVDGSGNSQWCFGIEETATQCSFEHCEAHGVALQGFSLWGGGYNGLFDCLAEGIAAGTDAGIYIGSDYNMVTGCVVKDCSSYDIFVAGGANHNHIEGCDIYNLTQSIPAWSAYVMVKGSSTTVQDCRVWSATGQVRIVGILIDGSIENPIIRCWIDNCRIWGFTAADNAGVKFQQNADNNWVTDCIIHDCATGIEIDAATELSNTALGNKFYNVTNLLIDNGTGTILPTVRACFIKELGTAAWITTAAAAMGIDIDAADEGALAKIKLPLDLQSIIRIKVWGIAQVAEADGMQLQTASTGAGGDNENWNTHPSTMTKTSLTLNFAVGDVIQWSFVPADDNIGSLLAGDFLQWCCYYAAASGANCATDLLLAGEGLEIQYV